MDTETLQLALEKVSKQIDSLGEENGYEFKVSLLEQPEPMVRVYVLKKDDSERGFSNMESSYVYMTERFAKKFDSMEQLATFVLGCATTDIQNKMNTK